MQCRQIMRPDVTAFRERDSIDMVAQRMRDVGASFVPVCDRDGRLIGSLSDHEIVVRVCAEDRLASRTFVSDVMTRDTIACHERDDVTRAEELMSESGYSRVLVVDDQGRLVGVIRLVDVLAEEDEQRAVETLRQVVARESFA